VNRRRVLQWILAFACGRPSVAATEAAGDRSSSGLSAGVTNALVAYGEVLVEGRELSAAERGYLVEHIEDSARRNAETRTLYRATAQLLDRLAGRRFSALPFAERLDLVGRYRLDSRPASADEDTGPLRDAIAAVRIRVRPDLIAGYWASPIGWAAVGYDAFPGRCGNLERYTRSET